MKDSERLKNTRVVPQGNGRNRGASAIIASSVFSRRQILRATGGFVAASATGSIPLIANLIAGSTLNSPAQAQISGRVCLPLESGSIISLECLGDKPGPRYLDGRTGDGTVRLAPSFGGIYTGTKWRVDRRQSTSVGIYYTFYCLEDLPGSNYLDGRTGNGSVGLTLSYGEGRYTGARWRVYTDGNSYSLYCLGSQSGPKWLDGRTGDGTVGLAPSVEERYTGTKWKLTYQG